MKIQSIDIIEELKLNMANMEKKAWTRLPMLSIVFDSGKKFWLEQLTDPYKWRMIKQTFKYSRCEQMYNLIMEASE